MRSGAWSGRRGGRRSFSQWDAEWWEVWSTDTALSPNSLAAAESRRRLHVLPHLGARRVETVTPKVLRAWQNQLSNRLGYASVMDCRSIVHRILEFAADEGAIPANPMPKVRPPRRPVDPDKALGQARRRALTPEEVGQLLACFPLSWWDHVTCLLGTGLRFGEFAGLRRRRVHLDRTPPVLHVVDTRYQAGKFGSGFKPLSDAFFRLDCRAADPGCTAAAAASSWHGRVHLAVGLVSGIATIAVPFVLAARMRQAEGWRDLARPTILVGSLLLAALVGYVVLERRTGGGYLQRAAIVVFSVGVAALALRVRALAPPPAEAADSTTGLQGRPARS